MSYSVVATGGKSEKWIAFHDLLEHLATLATREERAVMIKHTSAYAEVACGKGKSIDIVARGITYTVTNLGRGA